VSDTGVGVAGRRGVTISGGTISGFDRGVGLDEARANRVSGLTLTGNSRSGISVVGASDNQIAHNTARGNHVGIYLTDAATGNRLEANTVSGNEQGITLDGADATTVAGNHLSGNADNLIIVGTGNAVSGNVVTDALGCGGDCGGYGISLEAGQDNVIERNSVSRTRMDGIRVAAFVPELPTTGNIVRANVVTGAAVDGIAVATTGDGPVTGALVEGNLAFGSTGDGIHISATATTATRNITIRNAGYGIEARPGVNDGGGNIATANGKPEQCLNIRCLSR
jgi:parallel beta-helix repeat protein